MKYAKRAALVESIRRHRKFKIVDCFLVTVQVIQLPGTDCHLVPRYTHFHPQFDSMQLNSSNLLLTATLEETAGLGVKVLVAVKEYVSLFLVTQSLIPVNLTARRPSS